MIKKLVTSIKCSSCGQYYDMYNIDVLGHSDELWFMRALCVSCHTHCLVAAIVREDKVTEVITDLKGSELEKFIGVDVAGDDVLDMHGFLKDFDGDFSRLFGQE
ncbi:hypothetical protein ACFLUZ_03250 [Chloroflexota bacterium]